MPEVIQAVLTKGQGAGLYFDGTKEGVDCPVPPLSRDSARVRVSLHAGGETQLADGHVVTKVGTAPCTIPYAAIYGVYGATRSLVTIHDNIPPSLKNTVAQMPDYPTAYLADARLVPRLIASIHAQDRNVRIIVDGTVDGIDCPASVLEVYGERLVIDLQLAYPLQLDFQAETLAADLSFDGNRTRCSFPYDAVYIVADRDTGQGRVIEDNEPQHSVP